MKDWLAYLQWSKFRGRWRAGSAPSRLLMEMAPWLYYTIQHIVTFWNFMHQGNSTLTTLPLRPLLLPNCGFHTTFGELSCHIKIAPSQFEVENARSTSIHYTSPPHSPCFLFCPLFSFLGALLKENSIGQGTTAASRHVPQSKADLNLGFLWGRFTQNYASCFE